MKNYKSGPEILRGLRAQNNLLAPDLTNALSDYNAKIKELGMFMQDCAENWECDIGDHKFHSRYCRKCIAKKMLEGWDDG